MKTNKIEPRLKYKMYCGKNKNHKKFKGIGSFATETWICKICKKPVEWELIGVEGRSFRPTIFFKDRDNRKYGYM